MDIGIIIFLPLIAFIIATARDIINDIINIYKEKQEEQIDMKGKQYEFNSSCR